MNRLAHILLLFFLLTGSVTCFAQLGDSANCGTDQVHSYLLKNDPEYNKNFTSIEKQVQSIIQLQQQTQQRTKVIYTIPIVIHVIHLGEQVGVGTNISDAQIQQGIAGMNDRFRNLIGVGVDIEMQFCLATKDPNGNPTTGINRVDGSAVPNYSTVGMGINGESNSSCSNPGNETLLKNLSRWPNNQYYNIWIVKSVCNGFYTGYAYYPGASSTVDGAAVAYTQFTYTSRIPAHELGHGFFLFHTFFGDNNNTSCPPDNNCSTQGDQCCDTPPHKQGDCASTVCTGGNFDASSYNYMSYCGINTSNGRFTNDQKNRMLAALNTSPRAALLTSQVCITPPVNDHCTGATPLTSTVACNFLFNQSVNNATASGKPKATCDSYTGTPALADVWYSFQALATSHIITVDPNGSSLNPVIAVYNSCIDNTIIACSDATGGAGTITTLNLSALTIGNTYFVRVYNYGDQTTNGGFKICITHPGCAVPGAVTVSASGTFCNSTTLTTTGGTNGTIYWQATATNGTSTAVAATSQNINASGTYYFRANNSCGWGTQGSATVVVGPSPTADAGPDKVICTASTSSTTIGSTAVGGYNYSWAPATGLNNSTFANPTASPTANTTYTVTVTNSFGCSATDQVNVTLNPLAGCITALPDIDGLNEFKIIPNPSGGQFAIRIKLSVSNQVSLKLYSVTGQLLYQSEISRFTGTEIKQVNVPSLSNGVYLLETKVGKTSFIEKIVIARN
ncbi:MAG TPA: zinc-dependent metalloprotease [Chitinophagaceae bacterium]